MSDDAGRRESRSPSTGGPGAGRGAGEGVPLLSVRDLRTVFYGEKRTVHAVDGVSFDIHEGETVGLVGESGSGKTVTARSVLGLVDSPGVLEEGSIRFRGEELTETGWDRHRGDMAIVFQDPQNSLNPVYTVGNQIREALRIHQGLGGSAARERAAELLEAVGIPDAARRVSEYPHQFSGGMKQRAVIAIALACDPDLLICDEPTTALDVTIQAQILELLERLQRDRDLAILFITHDMGVVEEVCDRVNVMYAGEIVERAPVGELFDAPAHPYTQGLLASIPGRTAAGDRLPTVEGEVPTPEATATDCRFAPRCPYAFGACTEAPPDPIAVGPDGAPRPDRDPDSAGHVAACFLYDDRHGRAPPDPEDWAAAAAQAGGGGPGPGSGVGDGPGSGVGDGAGSSVGDDPGSGEDGGPGTAPAGGERR